MFAAVPDLGNRVAGWTIHPYGPNWATRIDSTVNSTETAGSPRMPIWVTEWGLASDNGRCLDRQLRLEPVHDVQRSGDDAAQRAVGDAQPLRQPARRVLPLPGPRPAGHRHVDEPRGVLRRLQSTATAKGAYTTEVKADLAAN